MRTIAKRPRFKGLRVALLGTSALAAGISFVAPSFAADEQGGGIETIVVTAEKRPEDVQAIPASVTAFSGAQLDQLNITNMYDLVSHAPSLGINTGNNLRNTTVTIRNVGTTGTDPGVEPDAALFLDGVYTPGAGAIYANLLDVSTVEILNGPQGTLYGRNSVVGAINITTRAPTQQTESMIEVDLGNYAERRVSGYFGGGITDDLAGRLSVFYSGRDGYELNTFNNTRVNDDEQYGGRGKLRWTPNSDLTVDTIVYYTKIEAHCCDADQVDPTAVGGSATVPGFLTAMTAAGHPFTNLNGLDHKVDDAQTPFEQLESFGTSTTASYVLPFGPTLSSISAYDEYVDHIDELANAALPILVFHSDQVTRFVTETQEFRILSPGKEFLDYVGGLYLIHEDAEYLNHSMALVPSRVFPGGVGQVNTGDQYNLSYGDGIWGGAAYGQVTANLTDSLRVIGGLRYSDDSKRAHVFSVNSNALGNPVSKAWTANNAQVSLPRQTQNDHSLTWLGAVQYNITDDVMAYFTSGSGFKDGGIDARSGAGPFTFGPEQALTYEVGVKSTWFDQKLLADIDVYRMLLKGFQQNTLNPVTGTGFVIVNAGSRRYDGVEATLQARPMDPLTVTGSLAYTDAVITYYPNGTCLTNYPIPGTATPPPSAPQKNPAFPGSCNYSGFVPPYAPKWRWNLGFRWEQPWKDTTINWFVEPSVSYTSAMMLDQQYSPLGNQPAVTLVDAQLGLESTANGWRVMLDGRNLTDEVYYMVKSAQLVSAYVSAGGTTAAGGEVGSYAPPRTFGIEGRYAF